MARRKRILLGVTVDMSWKLHEGMPSHLVAKGWDVHLVSSPGPLSSELANVDGVTIHAIRMRRDPSILRDLIALYKWLILVMTVRPDIVVVGTPKASFLGITASTLCRIKTRVYILHGLRLETTAGLYRQILSKVEQITMRLSTQVIAVSPSVRKLAIQLELVDASHIIVLGSGSCNGVDVKKFSRTNEMTPHEIPVIGFVGRITAQKGLLTLARALAQLKNGGTHCKLLVVGSSDDATSGECLAALESTGHEVHLTGQVVDTAPYFHQMDIFCLPTQREGLATVVLEAFSAGVPTIVSNATGVIDLVDDQKTGLVFDVGDSSQLAAAISQLLADYSLRKRLAVNASEVVSDFERLKVQARYEEHFRTKAISDFNA